MSEQTERGPVVISLNCEAGRASDAVTIGRAEWDAMTPVGRALEIDKVLDEFVGTAGGFGYCIADPDDEAAVGAATTLVAGLVSAFSADELRDFIAAAEDADETGHWRRLRAALLDALGVKAGPGKRNPAG